MNQQRHSDAVLAHLLEQLHIRSENVIAEKLQEQGASFDKWAQEQMRVTEDLREQLRVANLDKQAERERADASARWVEYLEPIYILNSVDKALTIDELKHKFASLEKQRDEEFAEAIALPVEPTPEDANHRD